MGSLGIAIDGGRYVRIDSRMRDMPKTVRLRTLEASQKSAKLDFCAFTKHGPVIKDTVHLIGLAPREGERAELRLRADRRFFAVWDVSIRGPGVNRDIRVRTGVGLWPLVLLILAVLGLGAWGLLRFSADRSAFEAASESTPSGQMVQETSDAVENPQATRESASPSTKAADNGTPAVGEGRPSDSTGPEAESAAEVALSADQGAAEPAPAVPAIPETAVIYFSPDSAVINAAAARKLEEFAGNVPSGVTLFVEGHCAEYGTERGRRTLSAARAANVANFLSERIGGKNKIDSAGFGSDRPATTDPQQQELNRRVEIKLIPENDR